MRRYQKYLLVMTGAVLFAYAAPPERLCMVRRMDV